MKKIVLVVSMLLCASIAFGADQVKIMCSGGVASPYDPLDSLQFSEAEIAAATDEARNFGRYVLAHAYTPEAITRAVSNGVRTIEHGNLIDEPTARLMAEQGMFLIANLGQATTLYAGGRQIIAGTLTLGEWQEFSG